MNVESNGWPIEITTFVKFRGPLTKRIWLGRDGTLCSDGSTCIMWKGRAHRTLLSSLDAFAGHIGSLDSNEAIALGSLHADLPDRVEIVTKADLTSANGRPTSRVITRTSTNILYRPGCLAILLIDIDTKGMPITVKNRIRAAGGFWSALCSVLPELERTGRVVRQSTSAGISRTDTGERFGGSNGRHIYILAHLIHRIAGIR